MLKFKLGIDSIPKKKLIVYIILILMSISGTSFFIYQNKQLKASPASTEIIENNLIDTSINTSENIIKRTESISTRNIDPIDDTILNDDKFKALKEVFYNEVKVDIGRNNPFVDPFKKEKED